ncbi:protein hairless [Phlebotomus argentipes]|uniref:protein hairless n=1 Tax=Phlebotomus argentipes TaxID=94469 RepID=UPI0028929B21|nr:protein hairless [Phlebotomus argentipes]
MRIEMQLRQTTENQIKINFTNNKTTTKCTKMTEESDTIRNGMSVSVNGGGATQNGASGCNSKTSSGGRLQFFKDGKFILELASARENENGRTAWVAVPRKTFWPPTAPPFTNNYNSNNCNKNESSTSLSFSDDNSSIQSSPWQRDHCWKQLTPRRNISQEMSMLYIRPVSLHLSREGRRLAKVKKRRPYDAATALHKIIFARCHNGVASPIKSDETTNDKDCTDAAAAASSSAAAKEDGECEMAEAPDGEEVGKKMDDEVVHTVKTMKTVKILKNRIPLSTIVQKLMDRLPTGLILLTKTPALVANHHFSASSSPKVDSGHQHVSPRKRILREFERVSLDDTSSQSMKRHRAKNSTNTVVVSSTRSVATAAPAFQSGPNVPSASATVISKTVMPNGSGGHEPTPPPPASHEAASVSSSGAAVSKPISSYSIISLLGHNNNSSSSSSKTNDKDTSTSHAKEHESTVSPASPCGGDVQNRLPPKKKQSPPYGNNNWSPKPSATGAAQRQNSSPLSNVGSPSSHNYNLMRSPDLSPSPEQQHSLSRYKSHYTGLHYSGSGGTPSGSSAAYHPYLATRGSPSGGTSSPSSEAFNSRYRSSGGFLSGSPQHNRANNNSPSSSSPYSRYSPIPNTTVPGSYHHPPVSPQHYAAKASSYSASHYSAPLSYSNNRLRSTSPCRSPSMLDAQHSSQKKTAPSGKQPHRSPVASPNTHDPSSGGYPGSTCGKRTTASLSRDTSSKSDGRKCSDEHEEDMRMATKEECHVKRETTPPDAERPGGGMKLSSQELEYLAAFSKANSHHLLSGIDMAFAAMIRPSPYLMYPPTHGGSPLHHTQAPPYLPTLPFYNPMYPAAAAAAVYRQQSWLNYPPIPTASRLPSASLLAYEAAASGLGPPAPSAASPSAAATTPWGPVPHSHGIEATENSATLDRIKDDPGSDVPLNLSKH